MTREKNSLAVDQLAELITLRLEMGMRQFIFRPRGLSGQRWFRFFGQVDKWNDCYIFPQ
jgi:hypothetical protein